MAEAAAPSAPAAPAPAASATDAGAVLDGGAPSAVRDAPGPDNVPRLAKSAKPIPSLPGVFPDEDPFSAAPEGGAATRGPDGRFVASPSSATSPSDGEPTLEPGPDPAPATPFEFAGDRFDSREAAEHSFKTLRGQHKPILALAKQLGGVEKISTTLNAAAESARGWKAAHDAAQAELAAYRNGRTPATAAPVVAATPAQPAPAPEADVDWELYAEVKKLATERNEPWKAEQWLIGEVRKLERQRTDKILEDRDAPAKAQRAKDAVAAQTETLFASLADYTHDDGSPAFPELSDEASAFEVGRMWASLGLPPASALTPQGAIAAIALFRMSRPKESQARAAAPAPPTAPVPPASPTDTMSAADLSDGRQTVASVGANGSQSAEAARILSALRSSNSPNRNVLGFEP